MEEKGEDLEPTYVGFSIRICLNQLSFPNTLIFSVLDDLSLDVLPILGIMYIKFVNDTKANLEVSSTLIVRIYLILCLPRPL